MQPVTTIYGYGYMIALEGIPSVMFLERIKARNAVVGCGGGKMQITELQASGFPYSLARVSSGVLPPLKVVGDPQGPRGRKNRKIRPDFVSVREALAVSRRLVRGRSGHAGMPITSIEERESRIVERSESTRAVKSLLGH